MPCRRERASSTWAPSRSTVASNMAPRSGSPASLKSFATGAKRSIEAIMRSCIRMNSSHRPGGTGWPDWRSPDTAAKNWSLLDMWSAIAASNPFSNASASARASTVAPSGAS